MKSAQNYEANFKGQRSAEQDSGYRYNAHHHLCMRVSCVDQLHVGCTDRRWSSGQYHEPGLHHARDPFPGDRLFAPMLSLVADARTTAGWLLCTTTKTHRANYNGRNSSAIVIFQTKSGDLEVAAFVCCINYLTLMVNAMLQNVLVPTCSVHVVVYVPGSFGAIMSTASSAVTPVLMVCGKSIPAIRWRVAPLR